MEKLFGMEPFGGDQWVKPDFGDGLHGPDLGHTSVVNSEDGEVEFAVAYSSRLRDLWGVDGFDESLTSWDLVMRCCGQNAELAGVVAEAYPLPDDDLLEALRNIAEQHAEGLVNTF